MNYYELFKKYLEFVDTYDGTYFSRQLTRSDGFTDYEIAEIQRMAAERDNEVQFVLNEHKRLDGDIKL